MAVEWVWRASVVHLDSSPGGSDSLVQHAFYFSLLFFLINFSFPSVCVVHLLASSFSNGQMGFPAQSITSGMQQNPVLCSDLPVWGLLQTPLLLPMSWLGCGSAQLTLGLLLPRNARGPLHPFGQSVQCKALLRAAIFTCHLKKTTQSSGRIGLGDLFAELLQSSA